MSHRNENGFSPLIIAIILFVLVIIGGASWMVLKNNKKTTTTSSGDATKTSVATSNEQEKQEVDPMKDWKTFQTSYFSVRYPDKYITKTCADNPDFVSFENDASGHVICQSDGSGNGTTMVFQCYSSDTAYPAATTPYASEESASFSISKQTFNGLSFDRRYSVVATPEELGPAKGTKILAYSTRDEAKKLNCSMNYVEPVGAAVTVDDFEQIVTTFKVL